uniref:Lazarillo protein n=1 Tax=Cacopsylla melanoneura TaxID=428564 RepID=A0A8D8MB77_9HEMI
MTFMHNDCITRLGWLLVGFFVFSLNQKCVEGVVRVGLGPCQDRALMDKFNLEMYLGRWYQQRILSNLQLTRLVASQIRCPQQRLSYTNSTDTVNVFNSVLINVGFSEISYSVKGTATPDLGEVGKLQVMLEILPGIFVKQPLYVLSTDYDSYSIAWNCREVLGGAINIQSGFVLSRHGHVDEKYNANIKEEFDKLGFETETFVQMNQHGC